MKTTIKTFEDACKALKIKPALPDVSVLPEKHQKAIVSHYKLMIITQALNKGWEPNWSNDNEYKYFPWFWVNADKKNPAGSGLSYYDYARTGTLTTVGSRLCFKTRELAEYAAKQFEGLYQEYLLINKL